MGMTMTQKILAAHAGLESVAAGQLIECNLDVVMANDITGPMALPIFRQMADRVFDKDKVVLVPDHFTPNKDIKSAQNARDIQDFSREQGLTHHMVQGKCGVEHAILPERGIVTAGECIIGADSHTCSYGALGAFGTGVGTTDIATGMATGQAWFKVPSAIKFVLTGKPSQYVSGKDIILHIIGMIGVDGALYKSMEFVGDGIQHLTMDDRFTICNMAIEAGGKNGIFPVDQQTLDYIHEHSTKPYQVFEADEDAEYEQVIEIDLGEVRPTVAFPHLPGNAHTIDEIEASEKIYIDQVVIGSCTNGRITDMRKAAAILKGKTVHPEVRVMVIPATQKIFLQCMEEGLAQIFVEAGCAFNTPSCGACMGGHMGVMCKGEKCVSTSNRNFVGRMGDVDSLIYLASPEVAAASALVGYIANPETIGAECCEKIGGEE
ncbi:MAG: 3-isopropylmalate dehydratase large subunit [Firmicutes bacterium]|nr:3-isopropylmalate dehydratase large subunit [Bacillota bacterium]